MMSNTPTAPKSLRSAIQSSSMCTLPRPIPATYSVQI
jgi:hypothetical protein